MNKGMRSSLKHKAAVTDFVDWTISKMDQSGGLLPARTFNRRLTAMALYPQSNPNACPSFLLEISEAFKVQFDKDMAAYLSQMQALPARALVLILCHVGVTDIEFNDVITFKFFRNVFPKFDMNVLRRMVEGPEGMDTMKLILRANRKSLLLTDSEADQLAAA